MPRVHNRHSSLPAGFVRLAALLMCAGLATGCHSTGEGNAWQPTADAESELRDPERLRLSFARMSEQRGDYKTAREAYVQVSAENPGSEEAVLGLARLDLLAGRIQSAERLFLQAYQIAPDNSLVIESLGQFYLTQDRFDEAVRHLSRGIELTPGNRRMRHRLAVALAKQGNIEASEPHFAQSVGDAEADYNIGLILYEQGKIAQAEERFLSAVLKKPTLAQAQHWLDAVRQEIDRRNSDPVIAGSAPSEVSADSSRAVQQVTARQSEGALNGRSAAELAALHLTGAPPQRAAVSGGAGIRSPRQDSSPHTAGATGTAPPSRPVSAGTGRVFSGLDLSTLNATQLEQFENSLSPADRARFLHCLRTGTPFVR